MNRITQKDLEATVNRINQTANMPMNAYTRIGERNVANIGHYYVSGAYGGVQLLQIVNEGGGVRAITSGYCPKRELYYQMHAFLRGLEACKDN